MTKISEFKTFIEKISQNTNVHIPSGYMYRYAPYTCWKCNGQMIIFTWVAEEQECLPPEPCPKTVQHRYTKMTDCTYWANVCPHCDSVQGRFFLHSEPDSPFFILEEVQGDKDSFDTDMEEISRYYYEQLT